MFTLHFCGTCGFDHDTEAAALACQAQCEKKRPRPIFKPRQRLTIRQEFSTFVFDIVIRRVLWNGKRIEYDVDNANAKASNPLPEDYLLAAEVKS